MKSVDLKQMKLPLSKKRFSNLRKAIHSGRVKWMDMSNELMYSYLDFWKSDKYKGLDEID